LPGCAAIPAPYRERSQMAFRTGERIVAMTYEDLRPSRILTRVAFVNAIKVNSAIGGSTNAPVHLIAIARHMGVELSIEDWQVHGYEIPLLANVQPAGAFLGEGFFRAGGVPAIMGELAAAGHLDLTCLTVTGHSLAKNLSGRRSQDPEVILSCERPLKAHGGLLILHGNLFEHAIMKTSVISSEFRERYLERPGQEGVFEARAIVFEGSEDYHARINDPQLNIDEFCMLVIRGAGPLGWPGSAEVVNMQPPDALLKRGITSLPTLGDGRQSGTSDSPSIVNASPESAAGGALAWVRTGDRIRLDLNTRRCDLLVTDAELEQRRKAAIPPVPASATPWQAIYRRAVGQLDRGGCLEEAVKFQQVARNQPRHNH